MKKHRRRRRSFCPECGGRIILARENEYYTATEPCCSKCGLVYEDEFDFIGEFEIEMPPREHKPLKNA